LLDDIKRLSLDKKGAEPLRVWISQQTDSEFQESRFKRGYTTQTKNAGQRAKNPVKIRDLPKDVKVSYNYNSNKWLEGIPQGQYKMDLTFKQTVHLVANSSFVDDKSLSVHQFTFDIYEYQSPEQQKENDGKSSTQQMELDDQKHNNDDNGHQRQKVELPEEERRNIFYRLKRDLRALHPTHFDNMHVFSFGKKQPEEAKLVIKYPRKQPKYLIELERVSSTDASLKCNPHRAPTSRHSHSKASSSPSSSFNRVYEKCELQFQEQGLNILNRQRFFAANYTQLHKKEDSYFSLRNMNELEEWRQNGVDLRYPDLRCLRGYKSSISYTTRCVVKTQLAHKLITKHSVFDLIQKYGVSKVDEFIKGKRAVTSYSNQIVELDGLDESKNLDSTFTLDKGESITFRDYYTKMKKDLNGQSVKLVEHHEKALVVHHRYEGRGNDRRIKQTLYFLPQTLFIIAPNENYNEDTKKRLRQLSHPSVHDIIGKGIDINKHLSSINKTAVFTTQNTPCQLDGYRLQAPLICFKGRNGEERVAADQFSGGVWRNVNGFWYKYSEIYGSQSPQTPQAALSWAICYDGNDRDGSMTANKIAQFFEDFCRARKFQRGCEPLRNPEILDLDYTDLHGIRERLRNSRFSVALFILGNNQMASQYKVDITRHVLFHQTPSSALSTPNASPREYHHRSRSHSDHERRSNNLLLDIQFVCAKTVNKRNAVFNIFETLLLKSKWILYYLRPQLPSNQFCVDRLWMIGIKILRKKGGAHLAVLSCNRAPFAGSIKFVSNHSSFISSDKDCLPQNVMYAVCTEMLKCAVRKVVQSDGDEALPLNIVILRASGGDSLFKTIISKELAGFKQSVSDFNKQSRDLIKKANRGASHKWHPGIMFTVIQENVADRFGIAPSSNQHGHVQEAPFAVAVNQAITSAAYFDIYLSIPTKQEGQLYGRVLRLITLSDEYNGGTSTDSRPDRKLRDSAELVSDYIALIYSSLWSYALNIPFPKVPNWPAPIKYADHYADWQYRTLTEMDQSFEDLAIDVDNSKPKILLKAIPEHQQLSSGKEKEKEHENDVDMK